MTIQTDRASAADVFARLEVRDVAFVEDDATRETILEIEVRGKRGL